MEETEREEPDKHHQVETASHKETKRKSETSRIMTLKDEVKKVQPDESKQEHRICSGTKQLDDEVKDLRDSEKKTLKRQENIDNTTPEETESEQTHSKRFSQNIFWNCQRQRNQEERVGTIS